jgi:hypothetical protein
VNNKILSAEIMLHKYYSLKKLRADVEPAKDILSMHIIDFDSFIVYKDFLHLLNRVEIKAERFGRMKEPRPLFFWQPNGDYVFHLKNTDKLKRLLDKHQLKSQWHLPYSLKDPQGEHLLNAGDPQDHEYLIMVYRAYASLIQSWEHDNEVITIHPPDLTVHNEANTEEAIKNSNAFYIILGRIIEKENWPVIIALENQSIPPTNTDKIYPIGYQAEHIYRMLAGTNERIQLAIDSGHRIQTNKLRMDDLVDWCKTLNKYIANIHFHGNYGLDAPRDIDPKLLGDAHLLPYRELVKGFDMYILRAIVDAVPLNIETFTRKYSEKYGKHPQEVTDFIIHLRNGIDDLYKMIMDAKAF